MKCPGDSHDACGGYYSMNVFQTGIKSRFTLAVHFLNKIRKKIFRIYSSSCQRYESFWQTCKNRFFAHVKRQGFKTSETAVKTYL